VNGKQDRPTGTLTVDEAARLAGVSTWTIHKWVQRGYLRPVRITLAGSMRFLEDELVECIEARRSGRQAARLDDMTRRWRSVATVQRM